MAARKGRDLETLVYAIESSLADDKQTSVASPGWLEDKSTGELREIDVLITRAEPHRTILIAVECKDWKRPLDSPVIESFKKKCEETGVNQGVIVSPVGFGRPARRKAKRLDIDCLTLKEATELGWGAKYRVEGLYRIVKAWSAEPRLKGVATLPTLLWQRLPNGQEVNLTEDGGKWISAHFEEVAKAKEIDDLLNRGRTSIHIRASVNPIDDLFVVDANGEIFELESMTLVFEVDYLKSTTHTRGLHYGDQDTGKVLEVRTATVPFENVAADIMVTVVEDGNGLFKVHHSEIVDKPKK